MINMTESAKEAVSRFISTSGKQVAGLRIRVEGGGCSGYKYSLKMEEETSEGDHSYDCGDGITVLIDDTSLPMLNGITMDFVNGMEGAGFTFVNPNATGGCGCGKSFSC